VNFFIPIYVSCSGRHNVGQGNVNILALSQIVDLAQALNFLKPTGSIFINKINVIVNFPKHYHVLQHRYRIVTI